MSPPTSPTGAGGRGAGGGAVVVEEQATLSGDDEKGPIDKEDYFASFGQDLSATQRGQFGATLRGEEKRRRGGGGAGIGVIQVVRGKAVTNSPISLEAKRQATSRKIFIEESGQLDARELSTERALHKGVSVKGLHHPLLSIDTSLSSSSTISKSATSPLGPPKKAASSRAVLELQKGSKVPDGASTAKLGIGYGRQQQGYKSPS